MSMTWSETNKKLTTPSMVLRSLKMETGDIHRVWHRDSFSWWLRTATGFRRIHRDECWSGQFKAMPVYRVTVEGQTRRIKADSMDEARSIAVLNALSEGRITSSKVCTGSVRI